MLEYLSEPTQEDVDSTTFSHSVHTLHGRHRTLDFGEATEEAVDTPEDA